MINYKAIILDLDGTLLKEDDTISSRNQTFLLHQKEQGVKIILATGRPLAMTLPYHQQLQLDTPLICLNGSLIYNRKKQEILESSAISRKEVVAAFKIISKYEPVLMVGYTAKGNCQIINDLGDLTLVNDIVEPISIFSNQTEPILKLSVQFGSSTSASYAFAELLPDFEIANWGDSFEITKKSITKWHGLQKVLNDQQLLPQEVIAFGDGPNDVEMLKKVGVGVAMENGRILPKKVAKFVTTSNENDGIAEFFAKNEYKTTLTPCK